MTFLTGFLKTIILLGTMQGFIVSTLLFSSKKSVYSNRILSKLIFLMALASFKLYASLQGWFDYSGWTRVLEAIVPMVIVMPMGPLIFFYIRSFVDPQFRISGKERVHFYPIIIDLVPQIMALIYIVALISGAIKPNSLVFGFNLGTLIDDYNVYADIPRWISITAYLIFSIRFLNDLKRKNDPAIAGQTLNVRWLRQFVRLFLVFQAIWFIYLVPYVIPKYTDFMLSKFDWYPVYIPLAILIYWLGIKGYTAGNNYVFIPAKKSNGATTNLPIQSIEETVLALTHAMEKDKLYLDPSLNLQVLSKHIVIPSKTISAVLNQHVHKSFNEFVNEYRINDFKGKLQDESNEHLTIAGIAFECGFNSLATFQRAFKQATGVSPSEFRDASIEIP